MTNPERGGYAPKPENNDKQENKFVNTKQESENKIEPGNSDFEKLPAEQEKTNLARQRWEKASERTEKTEDLLECSVDENIKETVTALNAFGINTSQSCEGHVDSGMSAPWVIISAPNEPEERYIGQNEAFEKVAVKYDMSVKQAKRMFNEDAYWEAINECEAKGETEDYKRWKGEGEKLLYIAKEVLDDFYKNHHAAVDTKINIKDENLKDGGFFQIFNGGDDFKDIYGVELSEEEKESLNTRLSKYREEMKVFAKFIKDKIFNEGDSYVDKIKNKAQEKFDEEKIRKIRESVRKNSISG